MLHTVCNQLRTFLQFDRDKQAEIMILGFSRLPVDLTGMILYLAP